MMHDMGNWGGTWWTFMWVGMTVGWVLVIAGIWAIFSALRLRPDPDTSEELLSRRLARGEITREEYRATLAEIRAGRSGHNGAISP